MQKCVLILLRKMVSDKVIHGKFFLITTVGYGVSNYVLPIIQTPVE